MKGRQNLIQESFREELQKYISGIILNKNQKLYAIYCMPDHVHILISINPDQKISELVRDIKANSSLFIKEKKWLNSFYWQEGYGAFSYSKSQASAVVNYIISQPAHHKTKSFRDEYLELLAKFDVPYNEKYVFEFYD